MNTTAITTDILRCNEVPYYQHNGKFGVLISDATAERYGIDTSDLETEAGIHFLPLDAAPQALFADLGETAGECERVDTDVFGGIIPAGDAIVRAECRNLSNEQRLEPRWEEAGFAANDLAERMLDVETGKHYDWESELTRIGRRVAQGEDMRSEWEEAMNKYSCDGMTFTPKTYEQIVELYSAQP